MTQFTLDTSGIIRLDLEQGRGKLSSRIWLWSDLTPFTQGYVEALFATLPDGPCRFVSDNPPAHDASAIIVRVGFSDLAPETLARIIDDCVRVNDASYGPASSQLDGSWTWAMRQKGQRDGFPPLTVTLGDDGKVRFT